MTDPKKTAFLTKYGYSTYYIPLSNIESIVI